MFIFRVLNCHSCARARTRSYTHSSSVVLISYESVRMCTTGFFYYINRTVVSSLKDRIVYNETQTSFAGVTALLQYGETLKFLVGFPTDVLITSYFAKCRVWNAYVLKHTQAKSKTIVNPFRKDDTTGDNGQENIDANGRTTGNKHYRGEKLSVARPLVLRLSRNGFLTFAAAIISYNGEL